MPSFDRDHPRYKWVALSNTTLGMLLATVNASIVIISLPAIFNGIRLDPLAPGNVSYLLWIIMGFLLVSAVLVVALGRLGDMYGRVKLYNIGFVIFSLASVALSLDPFHGSAGALWLIAWRVVQAVGGSLLVAFCVIETKVAEPMFHLGLFRNRTFAFGNLAGLLQSISRGGMQFMLIIWLQGIWLPLHGYDYAQTPLWAGIYLLPLTAGFLVAGPLSGWLSDHFGVRPFAVGGSLVGAASFLGLVVLPVDFPYWVFALLVAVNGIGSGLFSSPNTSAVMGAVPAGQRGAAAGMRGTFFNSGSALSIGIFFSLMIVGLAASLPHTLTAGLEAQGG